MRSGTTNYRSFNGTGGYYSKPFTLAGGRGSYWSSYATYFNYHPVDAPLGLVLTDAYRLYFSDSGVHPSNSDYGANYRSAGYPLRCLAS